MENKIERLIINKNTELEGKEDIKGLFTEKTVNERKLSTGEMVLVHGEKDQKIAVLDRNGDVSFIETGLKDLGDDSLKTDTDTGALSVRIWEDPDKEKPLEERIKNGLRLIDGGGLYVPEINVKDAEGNNIDIPQMKADIAENTTDISNNANDIRDIIKDIEGISQEQKNIGEKLADGVVSSITLNGDDMISVNAPESKTQPVFNITAKVVPVSEAKKADGDAEAVDGLASSLDVKNTISGLKVNGKPVSDTTEFFGEDITVSDRPLEEPGKDRKEVAQGDSIVQALMILQNLISVNSEVFSAGLNNLNDKLSNEDVKVPEIGLIEPDTAHILPGVTYMLGISETVPAFVFDEESTLSGKAGRYRLILEFNADGLPFPELRDVRFPGGTNFRAPARGETFMFEILAIKGGKKLGRLERYR